MPPAYIGRFAPSPTGPLHLGSLYTAVASFLDARHHHGKWHVRIDDIDTPRIQPNAADLILATLQRHGLQWDGEPVYQSQCYSHYQPALAQLQQAQLIYRCDCNRKRTARLPRYDRHCLARQPAVQSPSAQRLLSPNTAIKYTDVWQGEQQQTVDDVILWRKDDLCAYQLAVVVDDIQLGVTHCVRGQDLLPVTAAQIAVYQALNQVPPQYGHIPVLIGIDQRKLSKQNHAPAVDNTHAANNLRLVLQLLGQVAPPPSATTPSTILAAATMQWQRDRLPIQDITLND